MRAKEVVSPNTLTHIVHTFNGTTGEEILYVNGTQEDSFTSGASDLSNWVATHPFNIGNEATTQNQLEFVGTIRELAIYDAALTLTEVGTKYDNGNGWNTP